MCHPLTFYTIRNPVCLSQSSWSRCKRPAGKMGRLWLVPYYVGTAINEIKNILSARVSLWIYCKEVFPRIPAVVLCLGIFSLYPEVSSTAIIPRPARFHVCFLFKTPQPGGKIQGCASPSSCRFQKALNKVRNQFWEDLGFSLDP